MSTVEEVHRMLKDTFPDQFIDPDKRADGETYTDYILRISKERGL